MENHPVLVAPSLLAANFLELGKEVDMVNRSEADWFHLDVMDGRFVPNISYGLPVISQIKQRAKKPCDVHLMIEEPEKYAAEFKKQVRIFSQYTWKHVSICTGTYNRSRGWV